jgi:hypothetical protein
MKRYLGLGVGFALAATVSVATINVPSATAAQVYSCQCKGEKKRFYASSRYCEKQSKVQRCNASQFRKVYTRACIERGCRLP